MSSNSSNTLGARVNFFDSESGEFDLSREPDDETDPVHTDTPSIAELLDRDRGNHEYVTGVGRDQWIAGSILRSYGNPTLYCPRCWHQDDRAVPLSDPQHHLPTAECHYEWDSETATLEKIVLKHDHRRHRHCTADDCGAVSFGGVLADRPTEEFLKIVDTVIDALDHVPEPRRERLREQAAERKQEGMGDEENMERLLTDIRHGQR